MDEETAPPITTEQVADAFETIISFSLENLDALTVIDTLINPAAALAERVPAFRVEVDSRNAKYDEDEATV